jgi:hypothetical protein
LFYDLPALSFVFCRDCSKLTMLFLAEIIFIPVYNCTIYLYNHDGDKKNWHISVDLEYCSS